MSEEGSYANSQSMPDAAVTNEAETGSSPGNKLSQGLPQASEKGLGLLGSWLRRGPQQQQNSSLLTVKTNASNGTAELGTPTWSETSETSDFASIEASPAAKAASAVTAFDDLQAAGPQSHARLAGRLGGWFTGVTSAAGMVLGGAVRGGTKALQRLTAQERLQDLHAASQHLEATASSLRGEARMHTLQKWCTLLQDLHPSNLPLLHRYTVNALHPSSPHRGSCDNDWQQLQLAPPDPPDPNLGHNAANMPSSQHQKPGQGSFPSSSTVQAGASQHGHVAKGPELDFWANQVLYLDQESPDAEKELLTFRELFLHSYALENIIVGYVEAPASQPEDRSVLTKLFGLCLAGDSALHACLVDALMDLSAVEAECRGVGTSATLGPDQPVLANVVAETICGIKIQADSEVLDRKMAALQAEIGEQAAEVHRNHKFNSGATEPAGESSPTKLASGLLGTAEVMQLGSKFQQLSVQKAARVARRVQPQYDKYLTIAQAHTNRLDATVADLEARADTTQKQKADGEAFRERKLAEMKSAMHIVDEEVGGLEEQQAELLRQLAVVQQQITAAKAERADMEEGCHVFQEGNAFTLEALQHKVDEISQQHQHRLAEHAALAECQSLIQDAASGWQATAKAADDSTHTASQQAAQEFMHAATRHLYYQRALLQLLLRQLTFCVTELKGLVEKEGSLERMGMEGIISDMRVGKQRLQAKYLEAHAAAQHHFSDVAAVHAAVQTACSPLEQQTQAQAQLAESAKSDRTHAVLPEQASGAGNSRASPVAGGKHPLADTASQAKHDRASSDALASVGKDQPADSSSSRQAVGLSEELIDLFDSIQQLQQEVAALPQPQQVSPAAGAQSGPSSDQPKRQLPLGNQTETHANADQSRRTRNALDTTTALFDPLATQLDAQVSHLAEAAQEASNMASLSARNLLTGSQELSNASVFHDEAEGTSIHAGGNSTVNNQLQHTSCREDDDQHV